MQLRGSANDLYQQLKTRSESVPMFASNGVNMKRAQFGAELMQTLNAQMEGASRKGLQRIVHCTVLSDMLYVLRQRIRFDTHTLSHTYVSLYNGARMICHGQWPNNTCGIQNSSLRQLEIN